jgi:hypothetical protein
MHSDMFRSYMDHPQGVPSRILVALLTLKH